MKTIEILFWILFGVIFYTYIGYGMVLYVLVQVKRFIKKRNNHEQTDTAYTPEVCLLIAAYNEKDYVHQKVMNSRQLNYPNLKQVWVTDGSNDGTPDLLKQYNDLRVLHKQERNGKIAAINRGMKLIDSPIVVFSDANTLLSDDAILRIVNLFKDPQVGCVSGEKRIVTHQSDDAATAGEGLYWKYESTLKKWDAELNTAVGAAGELFAVRKHLFKPVENDTLLDDFIISLRIAMKGYKIGYDPEAYAIETASANVHEELKRKIRISAGGIQSILRLLPLLNIFRYGLTAFQYISHRVLRWTLAPISLLGVFALNALLITLAPIYKYLFVLQAAFYLLALIGWLLERIKLRFKGLFIPYYFLIMNYAVYRGFIRFLKNKQSVNWERAVRA
ncbi:MAG: glycosyltransferase family 2 protein [Carboxylicivirga sp.]|jgi:cellulose synthase/poly-beta-1,6-N-acetylglucosamine synthase-like glycosyltransferase|nr:glycosyltransferase family 2 protein [Carboxylicivirga sp.]